MTYKTIATTKSLYEQPDPRPTTYTAVDRKTARHSNNHRMSPKPPLQWVAVALKVLNFSEAEGERTRDIRDLAGVQDIQLYHIADTGVLHFEVQHGHLSESCVFLMLQVCGLGTYHTL